LILANIALSVIPAGKKEKVIYFQIYKQFTTVCCRYFP
jgi:hypothetical protein